MGDGAGGEERRGGREKSSSLPKATVAGLTRKETPTDGQRDTGASNVRPPTADHLLVVVGVISHTTDGGSQESARTSILMHKILAKRSVTVLMRGKSPM